MKRPLAALLTCSFLLLGFAGGAYPLSFGLMSAIKAKSKELDKKILKVPVHSAASAVPRPAGGSFSNVFISSFQANWLSNGNPPGTTYQAVGSKQSDPATNALAGNIVITTTATSAVFSGLDVMRQYYVAVKAIDANGNSSDYLNLDSTQTMLSSCGADTELFPHSPMDPGDIEHITPLGNLNPSAHTLPTWHTYWFPPSHAPGVLSPVYAPVHLWVTRITMFEYLTGLGAGTTDYKLESMPFREIKLYYDHMATVPLKISAAFVDPESVYVYADGSTRISNKTVSLEFSAGEQMGTPREGGGFDFGMFDNRVAPLVYANSARWYQQSDGLDAFHLVCPVDYFEHTLRDSFRPLFRDFNLNQRVIAPVGGQVSQDISGTAQGNWFLAGDTNNDQGKAAALVHDNVFASTGAFSLGASMGADSSKVYWFTPSFSGFVNRDFSQVTSDGQIYAYDSLRYAFNNGGGPVANKVVLVQMPTATTLRMEVQSYANAAAATPWTFTANKVEFER